MKIKYEFVTGEVVEIEVDEEWGEIVKELDRIEYNNNKKESRKHLMLDLAKDATAWVVDDEDPEETIIEMMNCINDFERIMSILNERQQELIKGLFVDGYSHDEYATLKGVDRSSITHQLKTIRKKLKKFF